MEESVGRGLILKFVFINMVVEIYFVYIVGGWELYLGFNGNFRGSVSLFTMLFFGLGCEGGR